MKLSAEQIKRISPMMQQYLTIKESHKDQILMFRLGDFYEMFFDDAELVSKELELYLTGRDCGLDERAPMCGFPYHALDTYLSKLVKKGYKVAICEQLENPALTKGMVKRDIIRVVTPGTLVESEMLDDGNNNYIASIVFFNSHYTVTFSDISTGSVVYYILDSYDDLIYELGKFSPNECIIHSTFPEVDQLAGYIRNTLNSSYQIIDNDFPFQNEIENLLSKQFNPEFSKRIVTDFFEAALSLVILINYLKVTQFVGLERLSVPEQQFSQNYLKLDLFAQRNLELTQTIRNQEKKGSLLWVLDKTKTPMGRRLLRNSIEKPLVSVNMINRRLHAVQELYENSILTCQLSDALFGVNDIERLMTKIIYGNATPKDIISLGDTTEKFPYIKSLLMNSSCSYLKEIYDSIDPLTDVATLIQESIDRDAGLSLKEGGVIRSGYDRDLDEYRNMSTNVKGILTGIEEKERNKTGIKSIKIGYNRVFGYYLEVSKSFVNQVPDYYIRKQTLVNAERYITEEIKDLEDKVLNAQQLMIERVAFLFEDIRSKISKELPRIQKTANAIAYLDMFVSFSTVAIQNHYCCPIIDLSDHIIINEGRHPVIEKIIDGAPFVPNDCILDNHNNQIAVITGPNMAGKSTYMRQIALIVIMAQMGSFVPAASAEIGIVDGVYTRVGASDDLSAGQSTFMVEMNEVAQILNNCTSKSLLILDEIGRGTSTFDGMSIARSVIEYIANSKKCGAKTLFATHYHELTVLEDEFDSIKNYNIAVKKHGEDIVFLRRIIPGGADESYGIEVSKLAGIPQWIVKRAYEILESLENNDNTDIVYSNIHESENNQIQFCDDRYYMVKKRLAQTDPNTLTPIEALNLIFELKKLVQ